MRTLMVLLALGVGANATATPVWSQGAGSAVETVDAAATFDTVQNRDSLAYFQEDGISVNVSDVAFVSFDPTGGLGGFDDGFFYANGGTPDPYVVDVGGADLLAVEFTVGSGFVVDRLVGYTRLYYETFRDGVSTGVGSVRFALGEVFGLRDVFGFDTLHVYNANPFQGGKNALALDDLRVERVAVDEPMSLLLFVLGLLMVSTLVRPQYLR
ncbi:MAG: hypothetical protein AAFX85_09275 [Pseudomonadota bacterium]